MKRWILVAAVLAFTECGGGGDQVAPGRSLELTALPGRTTLPASLRWRGLYEVAVVGSEDGSAAVFWPQPNGEGSIELRGQQLQGRQPQGDPDVLTGTGRNARRPSACRANDGVAVVWTDYGDELAPGETSDDESNVVARLAWPDAEPTRIVNDPHRLGQQDSRWVACLDDGETVHSWYSVCTAVKYRLGDDYRFVPEACTGEPADGTYLRSLDAGGEPTGETISEGVPASFGTTAAGARDSFVLLSGTTLQAWRSSRLVEQVDDAGISGWQASMTCVGHHCVAAAGGDLLLFDSTNLASRVRIAFQETSEPAEDVTVGASDPYVACDAEGTCVVTWVLLRETVDYDVIYTEWLSVRARAFDLESGRMGEPIEIAVPPDETFYESGAKVVAVGRGRFLVVRIPDDDIELTELVAE